jgi:putative transcriptional regulator
MPSHDPVSQVSPPAAAWVLRQPCGHAILEHHGNGHFEETGLKLEGKLLIAMPSMGDPRFEHSVVVICAHSDKGAMGLIINKPSADIRMSDVLDQLEITASNDAREMVVHYGGPVESGRGFVLHSGDYRSSLHTLKVAGGFGMTATLDILEEIARGEGPDRALMMLGYAGWGPGQLENEIASNGWLTVDASPQIVFQVPARQKWSAALESLGVDPLSLSSTAGHA